MLKVHVPEELVFLRSGCECAAHNDANHTYPSWTYAACPLSLCLSPSTNCCCTVPYFGRGHQRSPKLWCCYSFLIAVVVLSPAHGKQTAMCTRNTTMPEMEPAPFSSRVVEEEEDEGPRKPLLSALHLWRVTPSLKSLRNIIRPSKEQTPIIMRATRMSNRKVRTAVSRCGRKKTGRARHA